MTTRIRRAVAAAALTVSSLAGTAVLATPAWAADTVSVNSFGNLILAGGPEANNIRFFAGPNGTVAVSDTLAPINGGANCAQVNPNLVHCSGAKAINANGRDGNDTLDNDTNLDSALNGERGNDTLFGSPARDQLFGGSGTDKAFGGPNVDVCVAETESGCEQD